MRGAFSSGCRLRPLCSPAFAADPLPWLQETPIFADQVKSGALPPVGNEPRTDPRREAFSGVDGPGRPAAS